MHFKNNKMISINEQQNDSWKIIQLNFNLIMMIFPFNSAPRFSILFFPVSNDALIKFYFIICHLVMKWNNLTQFALPFFAATVIACLFFWSTPVNDLIWSDQIGSDVQSHSLDHHLISFRARFVCLSVCLSLLKLKLISSAEKEKEEGK